MEDAIAYAKKEGWEDGRYDGQDYIQAKQQRMTPEKNLALFARFWHQPLNTVSFRQELGFPGPTHLLSGKPASRLLKINCFAVRTASYTESP